jgi:hypothetical protein
MSKAPGGRGPPRNEIAATEANRDRASRRDKSKAAGSRIVLQNYLGVSLVASAESSTPPRRPFVIRRVCPDDAVTRHLPDIHDVWIVLYQRNGGPEHHCLPLFTGGASSAKPAGAIGSGRC